MDMTTLGRTGLRVSVAGLGAGGHSRLGQAQGCTEAESVDLVKRALDLGVTFFDTAPVYGTEEIVGKALRGRRDKVVISTKTMITTKGLLRGRLVTSAELMKALDDSLRRLGTDHIDVYNLHGVLAKQVDHVTKVLLPTLQKARAQGKIRFLGVTEAFAVDTSHAMYKRLLPSDAWDVVMVGFNMLNPSARRTVLAETRKADVAVQCMFAVRRALGNPTALKEAIAAAAAAGQLDRSAFDAEDPLGFLRPHAKSLTEAAYRFCRHEPGVHVVLTGTGKIAHLEDNLRAINEGPLPPEVCATLDRLFARVDCISGE